MRLAVATLCSHVWYDGRWWAYEPYVREANRWARLFQSLTIVAPTEDGTPADFFAPYERDATVNVLPFRHNRGRGVDQEPTSLRELPRIARTLMQACRETDAVCLRAPSNVALVGLLLGPLLGRRRTARYTGQWTGYPGEAISYKVQRALLASRWWRAPTLVYGTQGRQPSWTVPSFNALVTDADLPDTETPLTRADKATVVFVGRLSKSKNVDVLLNAMAQQSRPTNLEILGDGPERSRLESLASDLGIAERVLFRGAVPYPEVLATHARSQALVLASETEGWPKALVEGMAFGLACAGSQRGLMPEILGEGRGWLVEPGDATSLAAALEEMTSNDEPALATRTRAKSWARQFTLDRLEDQIVGTLENAWAGPYLRAALRDRRRHERNPAARGLARCGWN